MATEQIKNQVVADLFKENREKLNSLFNLYKFRYKVIDKDVVFFYLNFIVEPILEKNLDKNKEELSLFLIVLFEKILELIGKNLLGNSGRYPFFENKFIQCIDESNELMFKNPEIYLSSISNAILNIGAINVLKLDLWLTLFQKFAGKVNSIQDLFDAGKVAAWKCGMSQYRRLALEIVKTLDIDIIKTILDIPNIKNIKRENFIARLEANPWLNPELAIKENETRKSFHVNRVSTFSGFGGEFIKPPIVEFLDSEFILTDTKNYYILFTDLFGSFLQRISEDTYLALSFAKKRKIKSDFLLSAEGKVQLGIEEFIFLPLANSSSKASNDYTLCVTSPYSHGFFVIGFG